MPNAAHNARAVTLSKQKSSLMLSGILLPLRGAMLRLPDASQQLALSSTKQSRKWLHALSSVSSRQPPHLRLRTGRLNPPRQMRGGMLRSMPMCRKVSKTSLFLRRFRHGGSALR